MKTGDAALPRRQRVSAKQSGKQSTVGTRPETSRRMAPLSAVLAPICLLAGFCFLDRINSSQRLLDAFGAAVGVLIVFFLLLRSRVARAGRTLTWEFVPRPAHYVQFMMHSAVYLYWGWYWREVYHDVSLIAAQIAFAYALDMLVCWSRRDKWVFGFGPVPIVMSTNLFLWFKDDWFFLQFLLIATGVLGKEFIKWKREGRLTHIFNPSAFSLCVFSIALIATHSTGISWGQEIATTFQDPPHIYLEIFMLGLVVQASVPRYLGYSVGCRIAVPAQSLVHGNDGSLPVHRHQYSGRCVPGSAPADHRPRNFATQGSGKDSVRRYVRSRCVWRVQHFKNMGNPGIL